MVLWIMFIFGTLFLLVVMLNLIVAIMADTYDKITETGENATYLEITNMIVENRYLVGKKVLSDARYLILISDEDYSDTKNVNWKGKITALKNSVLEKTSESER